MSVGVKILNSDSLVRRAVSNILLNAVRYSGHGGVKDSDSNFLWW